MKIDRYSSHHLFDKEFHEASLNFKQMLNFLPVYLDKQESFTPKKYKLSHGQDSTTFNQQMAPSWHNLWMKDFGKDRTEWKNTFFLSRITKLGGN